jgi:hypothetical protein
MAWNSLEGEDLHLLNERSRAVKPREPAPPTRRMPEHPSSMGRHIKTNTVFMEKAAKIQSHRLARQSWTAPNASRSQAHASGWTLTLNDTKKTWLARKSQATCSRACNQRRLPSAPALIPAPAVNTFPLKRPKPEVAADATRRGNPDKANIKQDNTCRACTRRHRTAKEETSRVYS